MRNKTLLTTLLICCFSLLILLRLYAATQINADSRLVGTIGRNDNISDSYEDADSKAYDSSTDETDTPASVDNGINNKSFENIEELPDNADTDIDETIASSEVNDSNIEDDDSSDNDSSDNDDAAGEVDSDDEEEESDSDESGHGTLNDTWHGAFTPVKTYSGKLPRIVCWGDSLTESFNQKTAYPDYLRELSGCEVLNYGLSNELTNMIAMREGGVKITVNATVIPSSCDLIPVFLEAENGKKIHLLEYGDGGVNPCRIGGIEGTLSKLNGSYYFERSKAGERRSLDDGSSFETFAMTDAMDSDVLVIFTGTNDMPDSKSIYNIIDIQRAMLKASGCNKYVVIGMTYAGGMSQIDAVNEILANEYEDHFLDIRSYILNYGLDDAGIIPTDQDLIDIKKGEIPSSLRSDYVHGNKYLYELLANQVYRRMQYLGYLPLSEISSLINKPISY